MKLPFLAVPVNCILLLVISAITYATPVTTEQAESAAKTFVTLRYPTAGMAKAQTQTAAGASAIRIKEVVPLQTEDKGTLLGYVARLEPKGYILLTADDHAPPVKLYSDDGSFEMLPIGFWKVIETELLEDLNSLSASVGQDTPYCEQWNALLEPEGDVDILGDVSTSAAGVILLTTTWNQNWPYNYYCPSATGGPNNKAWAGCAATAMGQILRYYSQPVAVSANHTYTDSGGSCTGTHSINDAGMGNYAWSNMPNSISSSSPAAQIQAVGQLIYHCAVALESDFEADGTNSYPDDVPYVLQTFFGCICGGLEWRSDNSNNQWYNKIAVDIDASRPVHYGMWEADWSDGHAVVCDGYRNGNEIHLNLGWSGSGNAWYNMSSVSAGVYTWTEHAAVFGIAPFNHPPSTPTLLSPANGTTGLSLTPTLQASAFSDTDDDSHSNSQWQVSRNPGLTDIAWDSGENYSAGTQVTVPAGRLNYNTTYWWRVRYKDDSGVWSSWASPPRYFATANVVIYVDASAHGIHNGKSWADAYTSLNAALWEAVSGDIIWVAEGTYVPTLKYPIGDYRGASFGLINGVAIYGGFPSGGGTRNPQEHKTILSGDRYGDDGPNFTNNAENCYNVVTGYGTDATAILDGFTITAGHASGDYDTMDYGGGMNITQGSPTIANCTFSGNYAVYGGGMYNYESNPTITNCTFSGNRVLEGGGMYDVNSSPKVTNCTFSNNRSYNDGGGMDSWGGNPTITDCTFSENYASDDGGGMEVGTATVTNCTFSGNHADDYGGGIYGGSPTVTNCTFISNSANYGGGIDSGDNSRVTNCTFIGNSAYSWGGGINNESVNLTVINCTFSGNYALSGGGMRNLGGNPAITNCSFGGNKAVYGGGMFAAYSNPIVTNCTFSGNSAVGVENPAGGYIGGYGGGIYNHECNQTLTNCILWGNTALQAGNEIFLVAYPIPSHSSTIDINYCDIKGGEAGVYTVNDCILNWGDGNIDVDPMFVRNPNNGGDGWGDDPCTPANEGANDDFGDLRLKAGSPCLDVGDNEAIPAGVTTDVSGNKRMADGDGDIEACGPNTKLLLHLDGTDGAVSTVDSSGHHTPITFLGNAQLNTAEKKLGSASLLFDGNGDYLTIPYSADWNICGSNADNWIIDFWVKMTDYTGTECFMTQYAGTNNRWNLLHIHGSGIQFIMRTGGTTAINAPATAAGEITDTNWHHIALCKVGTLYAIYKDGVKVTSVNDTSTKTFDAALSIGHSSNDLAGRLDEIRITHSGILGDISAAVDMGAYELWDSDGDGIEEGIDKSPTISSNDFIDIPKLSGTITQRGNQILTITDEPDPCGVRIKAKAAGGGTTPAKVSVGGVAITYTLYDGNEVLVDPTSSIRTKVVNGTVEMMLVPLAGPAATTSLSAGNSLIFEDATCTISVPLTNPDVVVIEIEGEEFTLEPGESITFNQPPAADAGPDQTVYAWIDGVAEVTLDGSNSNDADGDALTYKWTWTIDSNTYEANGVSPTIELPVGVHTIQLVVNDGLVDSAPDDVNITVTGPAEASLCITPKVLNRRCFQPKVTAMLRLPKGITKDQIDKNQPLLLYPGEIEADWTWIGRDYDFKCRAWNTTIFASFDKDKLLDAVDANGLVELVVVGRLKTGQYFFGTDYIRVICPGNWPWRRPWWNWRWNRWCHRPFNCRH